MSELCARHGVLFVCDSVICGFGRLGTWYGIERFGVVPDMIVFAKGVSSGYLPVGGVVISGAIAEPLWSPHLGRAFRQGTTYAGHPTCCVAALTNLDIIEEEGLLDRSRELEVELATTLRRTANHPAVAEVRCGLGFLGAVGLEPALLARDPRAPFKLGMAMRERGVMVRALGSSIAVSPPLVCESEHLELIGDALAGALDVMLRRGTGRPRMSGAMRLYALHCGGDVSDWATFDPFDERVGTKAYNPYFMYVVTHPRGNLLFDSGVHPQMGTEPEARLGPAAASFEVQMTDGDHIERLPGSDLDDPR